MEGQLPVHVGIIMDGNGRWAKRRGLPRIRGHEEGAKVTERIVIAAKNVGIKYLSCTPFERKIGRDRKKRLSFCSPLCTSTLKAK